MHVEHGVAFFVIMVAGRHPDIDVTGFNMGRFKAGMALGAAIALGIGFTWHRNFLF